MTLIRSAEQVTAEWLSEVLGEPIVSHTFTTEKSSWAQHVPIVARLENGTTRALRLKLCIGDNFGRSEVDYYTQDYLGLQGAPLVRCFDAHFEPGVGYHLLLEDMSGSCHDRKAVKPTLKLGLSIAAAIGRMHRHHWESRPVPDDSVWEKYFAAVRPGVVPFETATGISITEKFENHAVALRQRWSNPVGMSLLHGDLNPTNILTPKTADAPVFFLDRQPFDWSLTYGLAVFDLAYALAPWWPSDFRRSHEETILRKWHESLGSTTYSYSQAKQDWILSVEQCLHVPIEWCASPKTLEPMRRLWEWQYGNITGSSLSPLGLQ